MTDIVKASAPLEGYVELSQARRVTEGADLEYVLRLIDEQDPVDAESDGLPADALAVHKALNYLRAGIAKRRAVQAGPDAVGDYCGLGGDYGPACGPDLGLPSCHYHSTCQTCGHDRQTGGVWWYRDHEGGVCRVSGVDHRVGYPRAVSA